MIDEGDAGELAHALGVVARARGMAQMAEACGIGREALYKALRPGAQPRFETISRVCAALGLKLTVLLRVVTEGEEIRDGVVVDYDAAGQVLGIELLSASKRADNPREMAFELLGAV